MLSRTTIYQSNSLIFSFLNRDTILNINHIASMKRKSVLASMCLLQVALINVAWPTLSKVV